MSVSIVRFYKHLNLNKNTFLYNIYMKNSDYSEGRDDRKENTNTST